MVTQLWLGDWVVGLTKSFQVWGVWESEWKWSKITQLCPTLWNPMNYTVHGILQARILEWVAFSFLIYARPASVRSECHWGKQEEQWDKYHVWVDVNLSWGLTGNNYLLLSKVYWKYHSTAEKTQTAPRSVLKFMRTAGWVTCRLDRPPKSRSFSISFVSGSTSMISCSRAEMSGTWLSLSLLLLQLDGDSSHRASLNPLQRMCDVACHLVGEVLAGNNGGLRAHIRLLVWKSLPRRVWYFSKTRAAFWRKCAPCWRVLGKRAGNDYFFFFPSILRGSWIYAWQSFAFIFFSPCLHLLSLFLYQRLGELSCMAVTKSALLEVWSRFQT